MQIANVARPDDIEGQEARVDPRIYANGFPKSGTHLLEQMVSVLANPLIFKRLDGHRVGPWAGCFMDHSWTSEWAPTGNIFRRLGFLRDGTYLKGHMGYRHDIKMFLWGIGAAVVFIYRDLRDVAVSLTHHIVTQDGSHSHPEWYEALGFDGALTAVIEGLEQYSGVVERWEQYAGWLDVGWVLSIKYEDVLADRRAVCEDVIRYIVGHNADFRGYNATIPDDEFERVVIAMVESTLQTDKSPTYRKGQAGEWRTVFKPEHREAFRRCGGDDWLIKLGYEQDSNW